MNLCIEESDTTTVRVVVSGVAVVTHVKNFVCTPAECTFAELSGWAQKYAEKHQGGWGMSAGTNPLGIDIEPDLCEEFHGLVDELACHLHQYGLSVTDSPSCKWDEL